MKKIIAMKKITIPAPLIIIIEDVGWWNGFDGSSLNQPFRTGMNRQHCPEDYKALALLGKKMGTQIIAGFVWCEWDRDNQLGKIPSATWMGDRWDNPVKNIRLFEEAADIINKNLNNIETGFHGLGHEFWKNGVASRTEFHDFNGNMRNKEEIIRHFKAFAKICENSEIKAPWPEIFIPPALKHSFGNNGAGFQRILRNFGFKFVITVFDKAKKYAPPLYKKFTKECGVTLIERGVSPVKWNVISAEPVFSFKWPILSLHWSNILHFNPEKNISVVKKWADFLIKGADEHSFIILHNVKEALVQLIYSNIVEIKNLEKGVIINLEKARDVLPDSPKNNIYVKTNFSQKKPITIRGGRIINVSEQKNNTIIKIKPNKNKNIELSFNH